MVRFYFLCLFLLLFFYLLLFFSLLDFVFTLNFFIFPFFILLLFIITIIFPVFFILLFVLIHLFFFNNNLQCCKFDSRNNPILLLFDYLFKLTRKVIVLQIFIIPFIHLHKGMSFIIHMLPYSLSRRKILRIFIFTSDTHKANLNFFLQIFNQILLVCTVSGLSNKKTMD